jgi:hypothetical protein
MNPIFSGYRKVYPEVRPRRKKGTLLAGVVIIGAILFAPRARAQNGADPSAEFRRISTELSADRLGGGNETQAEMEKALSYLDSIAITVLNGAAEPNLDSANRGLAGLVSHVPPLGENYRLVKLGGAPAAYAMAVNFGQGGPAAVRIYASAAGRYALVARIDHFTQKDFFDSDVELVPASSSDPVFVTISGRTDDLSTGLFSAWRLEGQRVIALWSSDLVQQSSYDAGVDGLRLAYCSQVDEDHPSECLKMSRDLYRFQAGQWKRIETVELPSPKPTAKPE